MKSVIEEIYYNVEGNFKEDKEYWEINKNYGELFDKLSEKLTDEQKKLLIEIYNTSSGMEAEVGRTHFREGFKWGMLVAAEVFGE